MAVEMIRATISQPLVDLAEGMAAGTTSGDVGAQAFRLRGFRWPANVGGRTGVATPLARPHDVPDHPLLRKWTPPGMPIDLPSLKRP